MALTAQQHKFLKNGAVVFKVLAWVALAVQVIMGLLLLIIGGDPVLIGGVDVPARVVGLLNCIAAAIYFFMFMLVSVVIQVLMDLHSHVSKTG
jgi:hypothetical protein